MSEALLQKQRVDFETRAGEAEQGRATAVAAANSIRSALRTSYRALEEMHTLTQNVADKPETFDVVKFRKVAAYLEQAMAEIRAAGVL